MGKMRSGYASVLKIIAKINGFLWLLINDY
jgi:hypothetical protein